MKRFIFSIWLLAIGIWQLAAQEPYYINTDDIAGKSENFGWSSSNADSVFFYNDTLWIASADSIDIYIPLAETLGMIKVKGEVRGCVYLDTTRTGKSTRAVKTGSGAAALTFLIGPHNGNGSVDNAEIAFTPDTLASFTHTAASNDSVTGFSYYPLETVTTLKDEATAYWTLRLIGATGRVAAVTFQLEYLPHH